MKKRILFVSHDATRTGAPIQLFEIAKWFQKKTDFDVNVAIIYERGELLEKFKATFDPIIIFKKNPSLISGFLNKDQISDFVKKVSKIKPDLVFTNTIVSADIVESLESLPFPIISRIPEMSFTIKKYGSDLLKKIDHSTEKIISPSNFAKKQLVQEFDIDDKKIEVISGFIPDNRRGDEIGVFEKKDKLHVLMVGLWNWRKGGDLFLKTAYDFKKKYNPARIKFTWVGLPRSSDQFLEVDYDINRLGLNDIVSIQNPTDDVNSIYQQSDVMFITSREDPMPIVGLEAASNNCIVSCFQDTGGMVDFVHEIGGKCISYGDTDEASAYLYSLSKMSDSDFADLKAKAKNVADGEYSYNVIMGKIESLVRSVLN